jgi:hypothetical protein
MALEARKEKYDVLFVRLDVLNYAHPMRSIFGF